MCSVCYIDAQTPSWSAETDKYDRLHPVFVYLKFQTIELTFCLATCNDCCGQKQRINFSLLFYFFFCFNVHNMCALADFTADFTHVHICCVVIPHSIFFVFIFFTNKKREKKNCEEKKKKTCI